MAEEITNQETVQETAPAPVRRQEPREPVHFESIKIGLASPEKIRHEWSFGEVTKPETINYRTLKPEKDGLFCERIFGPMRDWECKCGKYKKIRFKGIVCDKCGVEITKSSVRRERMGHIELASPVSHIWYFKGIPCRIGLVLGITPKQLENVLYFADYIVVDPGKTPYQKYDVISNTKYKEACASEKKLEEETGEKSTFRAGMGAETVKELLQEIDLDKVSEDLRAELKDLAPSNQKYSKDLKRLKVVEAFRNSDNKPEWMILDAVPVIPPDLRPMVQLDGGRFATSDLNDLYRRIINRNNRLKKLIQEKAPELIIRNEKRMLQEAVDSLIDNGRRGRAVSGPGNRPLKSLTEMLKGKQGRFRQNLLGKRVDYSGRSVIVVGPDLKIYQCGLPKEMAIELFKPFVMRELVQKNENVHNIKQAKKKVERLDDDVWDVLEDVIKEHPVMLNRAPTLHRLGIQAFEPVLVEGKAIKLHPLVCTAFNADFDGDQMAVHLPLSVEAQAECRFLMLSPNNLIKPSDGGPVAVPTQDMLLGAYYLTMPVVGAKGEYVDPDTESKDEAAAMIGVYKSESEAMLAYDNKEIALGSRIKVRRKGRDPQGNPISGIVDTTVGRLIYNEVIPQDLGFVDRSKPENYLTPELDGLARSLDKNEAAKVTELNNKANDLIKEAGRTKDPEKKQELLDEAKKYRNKATQKEEIKKVIRKQEIKKILEKCLAIHGATGTAEVLDDIKRLGYKYSTLSGISVSISDMEVPKEKQELVDGTQKKVDFIKEAYHKGLMTDLERHNQIVKQWTIADNTLQDATQENLDDVTNNIKIMAASGARGNANQMKQLMGMRGLMADTQGRTIELPIKSSFREGLDVLEYFISAHGARKGLSDTALRTADSGYLTRRLVDVSQDIVVREVDCCAGYGPDQELPGVVVESMYDNMTTIVDTTLDENGDPIPGAVEENPVPADQRGKCIEDLKERITGRVAAETVKDPKTGEVLVKRNHMITAARAQKIVDAGYEKVRIRSLLTCRAKSGICAKCYGANMATGQLVQVGEAVGIIAAQSIGEPGTQLTMRNFHSGGVAGGNDITQGLPRVEELFEARKPKPNELAKLSEYAGMATVDDPETRKSKAEKTAESAETGDKSAKKSSKKADVTEKKDSKVRVLVNHDGEVTDYVVPSGQKASFVGEKYVHVGEKLVKGNANPHDLFKIGGIPAVQNYLISEVQQVYRSQGIKIDDKHIEVIVRQMLKKVKVTNPGDSKYLPDSLVDVLEYEETNKQLAEEGKEQAHGERTLLGITKAALAMDSFFAAASFQETARVLTGAAVEGKVDPLSGLKENVIIGKLIPAGTGLKTYRNVQIDTGEEPEDAADEEVDLGEETEEASQTAETAETEEKV